MGIKLGMPSARLGVLLLTTLLTGCGSIPWFGKGKDPTPPSKLTEVVQQVSMTRLWSEKPTRGTEGRRLYLVPAVSGGKVFIADARGRLVALAADSGREIWRRDTGHSFSGGPDVSSDKLVLGTTQGDLIAFALQDGNELWRTKLASEVLSIPRQTDDGKVIVHTLDDTIHAIEAATGKELWRISYPAPVLTLRGSSTPLIIQDATVVGLAGGKLVKIDTQEGIPLWEVVVTRPSGRSELARIADIDADPILIGNQLYVGSYNGDLAAVDVTTGEVIWRRELSAHAGLAADDSGLFVTDSQDQVWSASVTGGAGRWKQEALRYRQLTAPSIVGGLIAVGDLEGYVHVLDKSDGRLLGRTRITKAGITARPVVEGGRLYVYAQDGTLSALTLGAGAPSTPKPNTQETAEAPKEPAATPTPTQAPR